MIITAADIAKGALKLDWRDTESQARRVAEHAEGLLAESQRWKDKADLALVTQTKSKRLLRQRLIAAEQRGEELARYKSLDHNQLLADAAARYLLNMGAENYTGTVFAITLDDQGEQFEVVVTTQKVGAKSPHEMHAAADKHNKELSRLLQWARQILPHRHTKIREEIDAALKLTEEKP